MVVVVVVVVVVPKPGQLEPSGNWNGIVGSVLQRTSASKFSSNVPGPGKPADEFTAALLVGGMQKCVPLVGENGSGLPVTLIGSVKHLRDSLIVQKPAPRIWQSASVTQDKNPRPSGCVMPSQNVSTGPASHSPEALQVRSLQAFGRTLDPGALAVPTHVPAPAAIHGVSELHGMDSFPEQTLQGQFPKGASHGTFDASV